MGGYHTEYSGFRFAMFFLAEYLNMFNICAIAVVLFFGGWLGPHFNLPDWINWAMPLFWFFLKTFGLLFLFIWIRATLPRMRYDQLMTLGWKRLIPLSIALLLSALLAPWAGWLQRTARLPRSLSVAVVLIGGIAVVGAVLTLVITQFVNSFPELSRNASAGIRTIQDSLLFIWNLIT